MSINLSWQDLSEITVGLVLSGKIAATAVNPTTLCEPYPALFKNLKKGKLPPENEVIELIGLQPYSIAVLREEADKSPVKPASILTSLEKAYARAEAAERLEKEVKKLRSGKDADLAQVMAILDQMKNGETRFKTLDEIKPDVDPFMRTGWPVLDNFIGGIPKVGPTIVGGGPGTGKTTWAVKLLVSYVKCYAKEKKHAAFFSMEMTEAQLAARIFQTQEVPATLKKMVHICEDVIPVGEIGAELSKIDQLGLVIVDFAELMIDGEVSESTMSSAIRNIAKISKTFKVPIVVLTQLNRNYDGSIPRLTMVKYSGTLENLSALAILLYNPDMIYIAQGDASTLPVYPGQGYMIVAKSRFGFRQSGIGAIRVKFNPQKGWADTGEKWHSLGSPARPEARNASKV